MTTNARDQRSAGRLRREAAAETAGQPKWLWTTSIFSRRTSIAAACSSRSVWTTSRFDELRLRNGGDERRMPQRGERGIRQRSRPGTRQADDVDAVDGRPGLDLVGEENGRTFLARIA